MFHSPIYVRCFASATGFHLPIGHFAVASLSFNIVHPQSAQRAGAKSVGGL